MAGLSTYLAQNYLNWVRGTDMPTAPAGVYVALYNGDPGNSGTGGTDVTGQINSAGRQAATFGAPVGKAMSNSAEVAFGQSESTVNVTHFGIWDAQTAGNFLGGASLQVARAVNAGDPVSFLVGDLSVTITP